MEKILVLANRRLIARAAFNRFTAVFYFKQEVTMQNYILSIFYTWYLWRFRLDFATLLFTFSDFLVDTIMSHKCQIHRYGINTKKAK